MGSSASAVAIEGAAGFQVPDIAYSGLMPLFLLVGSALLILLAGAFWPRARGVYAPVTLLVLVVALGLTCRFILGGGVADPLPGSFVADHFAHVFDVIFYLAALAAVALSAGWMAALDRAEYYTLVLLATAGMVSLAHAASLVTVFVGLELLSVVLYALTGFLHARERAAEAALKYFFLGAFASSFLLYGSALVYGVTGTLRLDRLAAGAEAAMAANNGLLLGVGVALLLVGFCFKISAVPFHMWTPDVYEGAPTPIAAFMSVGTKAAAFAALARLFAFGLEPVDWKPMIAAVAIATMLVGNLIALCQLNLKRMLAFSSVAHAGYALIGLVAWDHGGGAALVFYLLAYAAMNLGAFGVVAALEKNGEGLYLNDLNGLAQRRPWLAAAMALFLLSLAGVPPTAGFIGKFGLLLAAVDAGWVELAVLAVIYSTVAAYFYVRPIVTMYMRPVQGSAAAPKPIPTASGIVLGVAAAAVLTLGFAPGAVLSIIAAAVAGL